MGREDQMSLLLEYIITHFQPLKNFNESKRTHKLLNITVFVIFNVVGFCLIATLLNYFPATESLLLTACVQQ